MRNVALTIWAGGFLAACIVSFLAYTSPLVVVTNDPEETTAPWKHIVYPFIWPLVLTWAFGEVLWLSLKGRRKVRNKSVST